MILFDKLADFVDRAFALADRVFRRPVRRAIATALFVLLSAAAALYAVGLWDFTFISRPEPKQETADVGDPDSPSGVPTPDPSVVPTAPDDPSPTPDDPAVTPDEPAQTKRVEIAQMSDLRAEGYYVTSKDYDPETHRIAVLNVDLGAPDEYSVRERNVYVPHEEYEDQFGEATIVYDLAAEDRPSLEAYGGYLLADSGETVAIYDSYGRYVSTLNESLFFAYTRDRSGNPLFYTPSRYTVRDEEKTRSAQVETKTYYALTRNGVVYSDYRDEIYSRGVHADLPASYGAQTEALSRSVIVRNVTYLDLKDKLTGWVRTLFGFSTGYGEPFTDGWYDPAERAEKLKEAEEEYEKAVKEAEEKGEEPPERDPRTDRERFEDAKAEEEAWDAAPSVAFNYSEGIACVANEKGQMWFIDREGKTIFESRDVEGFDGQSSDYNGQGRPTRENLLMPLTNGIESLGFYYYDHGLVRVRRQIYDYWQEERYKVRHINLDDDELINTSGEKFTLAEGYDIISYSNGMILLEKNGKYGYMDYTGAWIVEPELDGAKPFVEGLAPIMRDGAWGVIDVTGATVIPFAYDSIQTTSSGIIVCHRPSGGWTVFAKMICA